MLAEFLREIAAQVKAANQVEVLTDVLPRSVFVRNGEDLTQYVVPPPDRHPHLSTFNDLVALLTNKTIADDPEVYVEHNQIVAFLSGVERVEQATLSLTYSKRFQTVAAMEKDGGVSFTPKDAVRFLRFSVATPSVDPVARALSRLDFQRTSAGKSHVEHGRESLGKSVEMSVQQADDVPKQFDVVVPVWNVTGFTGYEARLTVGVHVDLDAERVVLQTLPDQTALALNAARTAVVNDLWQALPGVPVFAGRP